MTHRTVNLHLLIEETTTNLGAAGRIDPKPDIDLIAGAATGNIATG